jgi:hypothetical protein
MEDTNMKTKPRYLHTVWRLRTYDVWGNVKDGFEVNDTYSSGKVALKLRVESANIGTLREFKHAFPTDAQLRAALGLGRTQIDVDGDDITIYINRARDGYPLGELHLESHASLSPISWERMD